MKIKHVHARQILDSRGNPTVECDLELENGVSGRAAVPAGASTGTNEAVELRDGDAKVYQGLGVLKAVENVNGIIKKAVTGMDAEDQTLLDQKMIGLDGTPNKSKLGANAILAVSLAAAKASANTLHIPLFEYVANPAKDNKKHLLPLPMMNIINGGKHANFATDIQEFMILPIGAKTFSDALRMGAEVFHTLGKVIKDRGYETTVGDEGGYAPRVKNGNAEALELIIIAVDKAGYTIGKDIVLAMDAAASEFYIEGKYILKAEGEEFSGMQMANWLAQLIEQYPIVSVEDGLAESDWEGWKFMNGILGNKVQIVGDDLLVTNIKFLERGINERSANAILIKPNQIGTLTETIETVRMAQKAGWNTVISHRSGETEDTTIAHLAVGLELGQIKTGSLSRTERICKYNELLRIEETLGDKAEFTGKNKLFRNT